MTRLREPSNLEAASGDPSDLCSVEQSHVRPGRAATTAPRAQGDVMGLIFALPCSLHYKAKTPQTQPRNQLQVVTAEMLGATLSNGCGVRKAAEIRCCLFCISNPGAKEHFRRYLPGEVSQVCLLLRVPWLLLVLASASDRFASRS